MPDETMIIFDSVETKIVVDIKLLRSFATVALFEHVGQAAERLHISQSPLSRQIQQLESELGITLFHRDKKRLRLTEEGRKFLNEVTPFLQHHDRLKDYGRHLSHDYAGRLDIGYVEAALHSRLLPEAIARLGIGHEADIRLHAMRSKQQIEHLRERAIDLALLHTPPDANGMFRQEKVLTEPVILAMPRERMLLAPGPDDLNGQPWIADQENLNPTARARLLAACQKGGFRPNICLEVSGPLAALACVEAGLGFTFIQKSLARIVPDNVALVSLPWLPLEITLFAVWRKEETRPLTKRFLATLGLH